MVRRAAPRTASKSGYSASYFNIGSAQPELDRRLGPATQESDVRHFGRTSPTFWTWTHPAPNQLFRGGDVEHEHCAAHTELGVVADLLFGDELAVDERPVRAPQITEDDARSVTLDGDMGS
jgi:hypothetical protein